MLVPTARILVRVHSHGAKAPYSRARKATVLPKVPNPRRVTAENPRGFSQTDISRAEGQQIVGMNGPSNHRLPRNCRDSVLCSDKTLTCRRDRRTRPSQHHDKSQVTDHQLKLLTRDLGITTESMMKDLHKSSETSRHETTSIR